MNIAVIGSRGFSDYELLKEYLDKETITQVISGGAQGADSLAIDYAKEKGIPWKIHEANWQDITTPPVKVKYHPDGTPYNVLAGVNRNTLIVDDCDKLICFWDGLSTGSMDSMKKAKAFNKKIKIIKYLML